MIIEQTADREVLEVRLTFTEMLIAAQVGIMREVSDIKAGRVNKHADGRNWQNQVAGAIGECAAAKALKIYWGMGVNTFKDPDVGIFQVRTRPEHHYDLILREPDKDHEIFILVTGKASDYRVHGWLYGHEGKKKRYLTDPVGNRPAAYFVPQGLLYSMKYLSPLI